MGKYRMELGGLLMALWKGRNRKVQDGTGWAVMVVWKGRNRKVQDGTGWIVNGTMERQE